MQIKDAVLATGESSPPVTATAIRSRRFAPCSRDGFDGFFSLEPHLTKTHALGGFSGPELFTEAWRAFTDILNTEHIPYA